MPDTIRPDEILGPVGAPSTTVSSSDIVGVAPPTDSRSVFARGVDALSAPSAPGRWLQRQASTLADWIDTPTLEGSRAGAMAKGFLAGATKGAGDVLASFSSPLGAAATLSGIGAEKAGAAGFLNAARALRGVEAATGAAFGARGLEQAASGDTLGDKALGVAQAAAGALGVRGGVQGFLRTRVPIEPPVTSPRGFLRAGPSFVAGERGPAAAFGETIPMAQTPDGSYVKAVPGQWAEHELGVRRELPPARGYVAPAAGEAIPVAEAGPMVATPTPQPSLGPAEGSPGEPFVRAVPAAPIAYGFDQTRSQTGRATQTLVPRQFSSDPSAEPAPHVSLTEPEVTALNWIKTDYESHPFTPRSFTEAGRGRGGDLEVSPGAAGTAIHAYITGGRNIGRVDVLRAIDNLQSGKLTPLGADVLDVARELAAGDRAAMRRMTTPPEAASPARASSSIEAPPSDEPMSVEDFATALAHEGETPIAEVPFALEPQVSRMNEPRAVSLLETSAVQDNPAYRELRDRVRESALARESALHTLPPAPKVVDIRTGAGFHAEPAFDQFSAAVDAGAGEHVSAGDILGVREPGQEGQINPVLAARVGLGTAGAAYGAATGDDTSDKVKRALLFGAAGALAPSLLQSGAAPIVGGRLVTRATDRGPVPAAGEIPADRVHTMPTLTPDVQDAAEAILEQYGGFARQRRGVQSVARTEALSDRQTIRTDQPLRPGTALNAERLRAYQNATATLLDKQQRLQQAVTEGRATPADHLDLERTRSEAAVLTASFRGAAAEAGRALHILRYQARILASGDPEAIREAAQASQHGLTDQARSYFYANILSGVATHERNILGNLTNVVFNLAAHPFATAADVVRSAATNQGRTVFLGELPERVAGTVTALPRAFSNALRTLSTGVPPAEVTSFDRPMQREFTGGGANPFNWPSRALEAADDLFATLAGQQSLYGAAFAQAKQEGLTGEAFLRRVADLKAQPSEAVLQEVDANRARLLFREKPGAIADAIMAAKRHLPLLDYVVPFVRVPANIIRQGFEASPAGFAMSSARAGGRAGADALGRAALGTVALAPLAYWAAAGKITGDAPADPAKRAAFYESGQRPNSIQIGNTWYSYQPVQPLNVPLSLIANGFQTWREAHGDKSQTADQIAVQIAGHTASSLLDQSFLSGLSALVDALSDPERYGRAFVQQLATGFVPFSGALRTVTRATDPYVRAPQSIGQGVQAIIPGQSETLQPRLTRFGEPVTRGASPLNVFQPSGVVTDPIAQALESAGVNLRPAQGPKDVTVSRGVSVPLEAQERTTVGQTSGRAVRQLLERLVATEAYQQASPVDQQRLLERAVSEARAGVRQQVQREALLRLLQQPSQAR